MNSPPKSSEQSAISDSRILPSRFLATSSKGGTGNQSKRLSVNNEDLAHVTVKDKIANLRICPFCFLERSNKPMTPSNFAPSGESMLSDADKIEFIEKRNNFKTDAT